jgi:hypothetical protein
MSRLFVFADEAGCFNFSRREGASRYFIVCTISCDACEQLGSSLLALRRRLAWEGAPIGEYFHASEDKQMVRDAVFEELKKHEFSVQATIMEKSKAYPRVRQTNHRFYQYGWFYHFKHVAPEIAKNRTELLITTASVKTKGSRADFHAAVNDVVQQFLSGQRAYRTNFCPSMADPCLQAADYCTWAIQKKWERADIRSYDLIKHRITREEDIWARGTVHQY